MHSHACTNMIMVLLGGLVSEQILLVVMALQGCDRYRLHLVYLLVSLRLRLLFLHLYLLFDASDLITHIHSVRLHLHRHFLGLTSSFRVSLFNHSTHIDLCLGEIHHLELAIDLELTLCGYHLIIIILKLLGAWIGARPVI